MNKKETERFRLLSQLEGYTLKWSSGNLADKTFATCLCLLIEKIYKNEGIK